MRTCRVCHRIDPECGFTPHINRCRECTAAYRRQRYAATRDTSQDAARARYHADVEAARTAERARYHARLTESRRQARDRRRRGVERRHGLNADGRAILAEQQGHRCAICKRDAPLFIDHDHVTGRVRGLLCNHCNLALGHVHDDITVLAAAIVYLQEP